jgi:hypothetical protein
MAMFDAPLLTSRPSKAGPRDELNQLFLLSIFGLGPNARTDPRSLRRCRE